MTDLTDALVEGERERERLSLRTGGTLVLTDERLLVDADDEVTAVEIADVAEVTVEDYDWFLLVLSVSLVGYGLYSTQRDVAIGLAFAGFGAASLLWTYRKRGKVRVKVEGRAKPLSMLPEDTDAFSAAMEAALSDEE
ncbi:hypothetical protein [Halorussus halophilus]|uniref:hypothetical protein n=1 Tax=Halorussus halophilus TaxID=2650975 RepID=UPI00130185B9|nr:hypothetical protein [Halorussus halophilus]